jgi:hypothetical protein
MAVNRLDAFTRMPGFSAGFTPLAPQLYPRYGNWLATIRAMLTMVDNLPVLALVILG